MPKRLIALVTSTLLIGGLFVGTPVRVQAVTDTVYVADVASAGAGGSCSAPDYATGVLDDDVAIQAAINEVLADDTDGPGTLTTVYLCPATYHITATLYASRELTLQGANAATTILDGGAELNEDGSWLRGGVCVFFANNNGLVSNLTFTHGHSAAGSGAIAGLGSLHIADAVFAYNSGEYGGAISYGGIVEVIRGTFDGNTAAENGGAITASDSVSITASSFSGNSANVGGAVHANVSVTSTQSTFTNNSSTYPAGAIYAAISTVTASTFTHNSSTSYGGAIYSDTSIVTASTFTDNSSAYYGGAIFSFTSTVTASTFTNNSADYDGGAIFGYDSATVTSSTFTNNSADYDGGAIFGYDSATVTSSTFTNNSADYDGGAISAYARVTIARSRFTKNQAADDGGVINASTGTITRSRFTRNQAGNHGGAVYFSHAEKADLQKLRGNIFIGNRARAGGAITPRSCVTTYTRSHVRRVERVNRFSGNRATVQRRTNNIETGYCD